MEGCGMNCIKYLLVVFNGIFLIFGIVIIAAACVDMGMIKGFSGMEASGHETDAVLIAIGVLIIVVAAFGCFGAWKESPKLLYIFAGCLIIIILLELSVGIAAAALRPQIEGTMKTQLRASFIKNKSTREEDSSYREFWDRIQSTLECCGVTGPDNYANSEPRLNPSFSCCPPAQGSDSTSPEIYRSDCISSQKYYTEGCEDKVLTTVHSAGMTVIVCGILFCFLEVAGIILALWLAHAIKTQGKSRETA
ncbi:23 kDa integral membrane protein-like [Pectinophora gossypiella]|uniref:23 kDa integral membrane protein-like n=1 Tax=Pectinophora gossypiella TaxID=13191 RepID=UPI00214F5CF7|nr:23 kDa integral membrane protein-like [Pectinophora gossypiella]